MPALLHTLHVATHAPITLLDLTEPVRAWVRSTGVRDGLLTLRTPHTTARIVINEPDAALQEDMRVFLDRLAPPGAGYAHDQHPVDDRRNTHSHLLGLLLPSSESLPLRDGDLLLGAWQAVFLLELDGPRPQREVQLHLLPAP